MKMVTGVYACTIYWYVSVCALCQDPALRVPLCLKYRTYAVLSSRYRLQLCARLGWTAHGPDTLEGINQPAHPTGAPARPAVLAARNAAGTNAPDHSTGSGQLRQKQQLH